MNQHPVPRKVAGMPGWSAHAGSLRRQIHAVRTKCTTAGKSTRACLGHLRWQPQGVLGCTGTPRHQVFQHVEEGLAKCAGGRHGLPKIPRSPTLKQLATAALLRRPPAFRGSRCTRPRSRAAGLRAGSRPPRARRRSCRGTRGSASAASSR